MSDRPNNEFFISFYIFRVEPWVIRCSFSEKADHALDSILHMEIAFKLLWLYYMFSSLQLVVERENNMPVLAAESNRSSFYSWQSNKLARKCTFGLACGTEGLNCPTFSLFFFFLDWQPLIYLGCVVCFQYRLEFQLTQKMKLIYDIPMIPQIQELPVTVNRSRA